jgi:hypothetical protein
MWGDNHINVAKPVKGLISLRKYSRSCWTHWLVLAAVSQMLLMMVSYIATRKAAGTDCPALILT